MQTIDIKQSEIDDIKRDSKEIEVNPDAKRILAKHGRHADVLERTLDKDGLSCKERLICDEYIKNNYVLANTAMALGYKSRRDQTIRKTIQLPRCRSYIEKHVAEIKSHIDHQLKTKYDNILGRLMVIVDAFVTTVEQTREVDPKRLNCALTAIKEINAMRGHHAAQQYEVKQDITNEIKVTIDTTRQIYDQYKQEY